MNLKLNFQNKKEYYWGDGNTLQLLVAVTHTHRIVYRFPHSITRHLDRGVTEVLWSDVLALLMRKLESDVQRSLSKVNMGQRQTMDPCLQVLSLKGGAVPSHSSKSNCKMGATEFLNKISCFWSIAQHCPVELSTVMEMFYFCSIQHGSQEAHIAILHLKWG